MNLAGKAVQLDKAVESQTGPGIPAGLTGKVTWDDGSDDVVVDFGRPVPGSGFFPEGTTQAWVRRSQLSCLNDTVTE